MINFFVENNFEWSPLATKKYRQWLERITDSEGVGIGDVNYIFCDDEYLHGINVNYLHHDDYTDIITFDNSTGVLLECDIFISTERVLENARKYKVNFDRELKRVMAHGLLHCMTYNDKTDEERKLMRQKEDEKIDMFHVEH